MSSPLAEQLREDVARLATQAGREAGSAGHSKARTYLLGRLADLGLEGYGDNRYEWEYEGRREHAGRLFTNVLARLPGKHPNWAPIVVAAHYDTCGPFPGADDNAAAIAIALALVKPLRDAALDRPVVFAFFDAEEPPFHLSPSMGSIRFYHDQRLEPIHCALVMDLCGHNVPLPSLEDLLFITGAESDPGLVESLNATATPSGIRPVLTLNRYIGDMSDHHVFRMEQRPYLFFSCGRWEHYHRPTDTPEVLNYEKMEALATYLTALTAQISGRPLEGPFEEEDTVSVELAFLDRAVGPFLRSLGFTPQTRADLDAMVQMLVAQLGL